jgi:hypothetical protein
MREYQFFESIIEKINSVKCKSNFSCVMPCALLDAPKFAEQFNGALSTHVRK